MPIYEYRCTSCGFEEEYLRKVSAPLLTECPKCHAASFTKKLTAAGFQLKGSGWYATDFKNSAAKPKGKSDAAKTDDAKPDSAKPDQTSGAKTETKSSDTATSAASGAGASTTANS
jgi:putative FmdB family regulatory protein